MATLNLYAVKKLIYQIENHHYLGRGTFIGATIGILMSILLFQTPTLGMGIGAAIGWLIGALIDKQRKKSG